MEIIFLFRKGGIIVAMESMQNRTEMNYITAYQKCANRLKNDRTNYEEADFG